MEKHHSNIFLYDKKATQSGYGKLNTEFSDLSIKNNCLSLVKDAMKRNDFDIGIDFSKPWEELELDENHYQIEYLFVGKIINKTKVLKDIYVGINIFQENRFGKNVFDSEDILNLTLIVEK